MNFEQLNIIEPICRSVKILGYEQPTPIQEKAIPYVLAGKDVFGCAQTGTGKTAAFAIPILQLFHLKKIQREPGIKALVLAPTRELAIQIDESFRDYGKGLGLRHTVIFGGVSQVNQVNALRKGIDILIATPGRLLDLMDQGHVKLNHVEFFVLDEVDRMLDMGFINDIRKVIARIPAKRQTVFFSATVPPDIKKLADGLLHQPVQVQVAAVSAPADTVKQQVYYVEKTDKRALLKQVIEQEHIDHALVFTRTKRGADRVAKDLTRSGIRTESIHGDKSQGARQRALEGFKNRTIRILVATDIASRGIDVDKLTHVINFELPEVPETYVHRIGRTGRAGENGTAISFCSSEEMDSLKEINRLLKRNLEVVNAGTFVPSPKTELSQQQNQQRKPQQGGHNRAHSKKNNFRRRKR